MPGPGGWGRRAAGRIERDQRADDELLKSLGEEFKDYAQWERTATTTNNIPTSVNVGKRPKERPKSEVVSSTGLITAVKGRKKSSSSCHGNSINDVIKEEKKTDPAKAERMKILQLRIKARKQTLKDYKQRETELLESNGLLKDEIEEQEKDAHENVKAFLRKYERFRGGIVTLNRKFHNHLLSTMHDFEETKEGISNELDEIQNQQSKINKKLRNTQSELYTLHNYKDKEYPVKALQINDLQKEIQHLKIANEDELDELEHLTSTMLVKIRTEQCHVENDFTAQLTEESIERMHPTLKDMALQNMVMIKEKEFHRSEIDDLTAEIKGLEQKLKTLKTEQGSTREEIFPELYPNRPKCTPDMDIVLDIPTQQWLPI